MLIWLSRIGEICMKLLSSTEIAIKRRLRRWGKRTKGILVKLSRILNLKD